MVNQMAENDFKIDSGVITPVPPSIATDAEFVAGTSTTASPTVKQVAENYMNISTNQDINGYKRFIFPYIRAGVSKFTFGVAPSAQLNNGVHIGTSVEGEVAGAIQMVQTTEMTAPDMAFTLRSVDNTGYTDKFQVVSVLPASPDERVFYFIPE